MRTNLHSQTMAQIQLNYDPTDRDRGDGLEDLKYDVFYTNKYQVTEQTRTWLCAIAITTVS